MTSPADVSAPGHKCGFGRTAAGASDGGIRAFFANFDASTAFLPAITIMEIEFGISREQKRDPAFAAELDQWFRAIVLPRFHGRILPFDADAASIAGKLPTADKRPSPDAMIAAIALLHGLDLVTRNTAHFEPLGVRCLNPWM